MKKIFLLSLLMCSILFADSLHAQQATSSNLTGPGPTSCEKGTTWDSKINRCVECGKDTTPTLINSVWQCIRPTKFIRIVASSTNAIMPVLSSSTQVMIKQTPSGIILMKQGELEVSSNKKIDFEDNKVYMETASGKKQIKILPEQASAIVKNKNFSTTSIITGSTTSSTTIELKEDAQKPTYYVTMTKPAKFLFLIPVNVPTETKISADNGTVLSVSKPWWNFLAW